MSLHAYPCRIVLQGTAGMKRKRPEMLGFPRATLQHEKGRFEAARST
jgi:hypothetical protein